MSGEWTRVAAVGELPPGAWRTLEIDDTLIAVFNLDGEYYAVENVCTHEYAELTEGEVRGGVVACPLHGAEFDLRTGEALSPPAYEPLATFEVRVCEGAVEVRAPSSSSSRRDAEFMQ